jgi:hypothetical protein
LSSLFALALPNWSLWNGTATVLRVTIGVCLALLGRNRSCHAIIFAPADLLIGCRVICIIGIVVGRGSISCGAAGAVCSLRRRCGCRYQCSVPVQCPGPMPRATAKAVAINCSLRILLLPACQDVTRTFRFGCNSRSGEGAGEDLSRVERLAVGEIADLMSAGGTVCNNDVAGGGADGGEQGNFGHGAGDVLFA